MKDNAIADALSRFPDKPTGGDPYPVWALRPKFRARAVDHCGAMDVDTMSDDEGVKAWCAHFRSPARPAFEGLLQSGYFWSFSRIDLIDLTLGCVIRSIKEE